MRPVASASLTGSDRNADCHLPPPLRRVDACDVLPIASAGRNEHVHQEDGLVMIHFTVGVYQSKKEGVEE